MKRQPAPGPPRAGPGAETASWEPRTQALSARVARSVAGAAAEVGVGVDWRSGGTRREEFPAKSRKSLLQGGVFKPIERATGDEDEIEAGREGGLVGAKPLAEAAFGAGARAGEGGGAGGGGGGETGGGAAARGESGGTWAAWSAGGVGVTDVAGAGARGGRRGA